MTKLSAVPDGIGMRRCWWSADGGTHLVPTMNGEAAGQTLCGELLTDPARTVVFGPDLTDADVAGGTVLVIDCQKCEHAYEQGVQSVARARGVELPEPRAATTPKASP